MKTSKTCQKNVRGCRKTGHPGVLLSGIGQGLPRGTDPGMAGLEGFTLTEIMIVVAIIGLIAAIAVPNYVRARTSAQVQICIRNLQKIDSAKGQWAFENKKSNHALPTASDIGPYLNDDKLPLCPANGTYRLRRISKLPTCSLYAEGHTLRNLNMDDDPNED